MSSKVQRLLCGYLVQCACVCIPVTLGQSNVVFREQDQKKVNRWLCDNQQTPPYGWVLSLAKVFENGKFGAKCLRTRTKAPLWCFLIDRSCLRVPEAPGTPGPMGPLGPWLGACPPLLGAAV